MKGTAIVATMLLLTTALAALPVAEASGTTRLVAFGDTSANSATQRNVDGALAEGAQGYIGLGDYNYDHSVSAWKTMFRPLTDKGSWMALGNHDDRYAMAEYFPDGSRWSKSVHGARIVALNGMAPVDTARLRSDLCNAPESVRIVITHHNWWLGSAAHHPGSEFPTSASTMDDIMKDCGVDLILAGHEHNYQRMTRNGIPYVIVGTGGRGIYPLEGVPSGTVATCECLGRLLLDLGATGFSATFKRLDGSVQDTFSMGTTSAPGSDPSPSPTASAAFTPKGGNEWWVQVAVSGSPTSVSARDTNGAWIALAKKSWGDWAASFHVEPGHDVQYRATLADGTIAESCWYDHPAGGCTTTTTPTPSPSPSPSPSIAFDPSGGNEWWVEVDVSGSPTSVSARDTNGAWIALAKKSWGDWAASFHVEPGHDVQYRATLADGTVTESCWYDHPAKTCASPASPSPTPGTNPSTGSFSATFSNARGNEWWVEANVAVTGGTLARVDAKVNDGSWVALEKKSWGSWAKSIRASAGSQVTFQAVSSDGQTSSSGPYAWPPR